MINLGRIIKECVPDGYYVGGALRDALMRRYSSDIDLAMPREDVKPSALKLAAKLKAAAFEMDKEFCVWRISGKNGLQIDLCAFIGKDVKTDLKRRDFTINALAYPINSPIKIKLKKEGKKIFLKLFSFRKDDIIDLNGGIADIKNKIVRANAPQVFQEDPLRLLRAFRTACELNFKIEDKTLSLINKYSSLAFKPAGERIQEELRRIFFAKNTAAVLREMDETGVLCTLLPELEKQKNCALCYYGAGGVFTHTMKVMERMEFLLGNLKRAFPKHYGKLKPYAKDISIYKMAALLHDIAKPATAKEINGRLRFFYHEERGSEMAERFLKNLKFSSDNQKLICKMIYYHLRPSNLASNEIVTDKGIYKFFKELGSAGIPMLLLCWADYTSYVKLRQIPALMKKSVLPVMTMEDAKKKENVGKTLRHMQMLNFLFGKYFNEEKRFTAPVRLIDGRDIMKVLKIVPGPKVGEIMEQVVLEQVEGNIKTREDALRFLSENKSRLLG